MELLQSNRIKERNPKELRHLNQEAKILWARREELEVNESGLCLKSEKGHSRIGLFVPFERRHLIVEEYHKNHCHIGVQKTLKLLKERFYWPRMEETINLIIGACKECLLTKMPPPRDKAPLQSTQTGEPFERISIDLSGPFPITASGHRYILGVIDNFSKFCSLIPLKNAEAKTVCHALYSQWITVFGAPVEIKSDNGSSFRNRIKEELCELLGIKEIYSPPYYPQGNGLVERLFRTAKKLINASVVSNRKEWDDALPTVNMALRNSISQTTKFAPFEVVFGKTARLPLDWQFYSRNSKLQFQSENEYIIQLQRHLRETEEMVRKNVSSSIKKQADYYNKRNLCKVLEVGDQVLLRETRTKKNFKKCDYHGPYEIVKKLGEWTYELKDTESGQTMRRSYNQIKRFRLPPVCMDSSTIQAKTPVSITPVCSSEKGSKEDKCIEFVPNAESPNINETNVNEPKKRSVRQRKQPDRLGFPLKSGANLYA